MVVAALVAVPLVLGGVYIAGHGGGAWLSTQYHSALSEAGPANDVQRLTSLGTSGRVPWYREALRGFSHHPLLGTGAGTFRMTDDLYRTNLVVVKHSHGQWLNLLTELGLVGFALFVVAIGGLMAAAFSRALRDRRDPHRSLLAACQAAIGAFVVHMSIDWDWDMAAITVAFLLLAGVSAAYVRDRGAWSERVRASTPRRRRRRGERPGASQRSVADRSLVRDRRRPLRRRLLGAPVSGGARDHGGSGPAESRTRGGGGGRGPAGRRSEPALHRPAAGAGVRADPGRK